MPASRPHKSHKPAALLAEPALGAARWRALALATGQITWIADAAGNATECASWCAFTGQFPEEGRGLGWITALHPDDQAAMPAYWAKIVAEAIPFVVEMRVRRHDGEYRLLLNRGVPIRDSQGQISEWVGVSQDITEQRALEERLKRHSQEMEGMLAAVSHELRHPLTVLRIKNALSLRCIQAALHAPALPETRVIVRQIAGLVERGAQQTQRMERMVADLMDIAHIEAGKFTLDMRPGDVGDLARLVVQEMAQIWPERTVTLTLDPDARFPVQMDADRIEQVLDNFLTNAQKYTPAGSALHVSVTADAMHVRVAVCDEGPGLTPELAARIWDKYYQVNPTSSQSGAQVGLGLGLFICHSLIEAHGGAVGVDSAEGQGATFWFTLPLLAPSAKP